MKQLPELSDVASDQQVQGLRARLVFDRDTASRLGITPSTIDQTLYDAYGQREVSTIFTQLNQYHVVLEVSLEFAQQPGDLRDLFIRTGTGYPSGSTGLVSGGSSTPPSPAGPPTWLLPPRPAPRPAPIPRRDRAPSSARQSPRPASFRPAARCR